MLPSGITDFKSLQEHIDTPDPAIRYFAFDLLFLDGKDLRKEPLIERKERLRELMAAKGVSDFLIYSDHVVGSGPAFYEQGVRRASRRHHVEAGGRALPLGPRQGLAQDQVPLHAQEFVIGGYSKSDVRGKPFSSLLLGTFDGGKLIYAGKVGTGFNAADFRNLAKRFDASSAQDLAVRRGAGGGAQGCGVARA